VEFTSDESYHHELSADDDDFHAPSAERWFFESTWWWWFNAAEQVGGWLYGWVRPNMSMSGGSVYVFDESAFTHLDALYSANYSNLALPTDRNLRDFTFPAGLSIKVLEPLTRYELSVSDDDVLDVRLTFDATMPPWVGALVAGEHGDRPRHLDQFGRLRGHVLLRERHIDVDCVAIRDRSWYPRAERWKVGKVGYVSAGDDAAGVAFLVLSAEGIRDQSEDRVYSGFLLRDGRRARLVDGTRRVQRHPTHGYIERIDLDVTDSLGRPMRAHGESVSRMAMPIPGVHGVCWTSLICWNVDGIEIWGDDQDAWPIHGWSRFRRGQLDRG
jgi:hypothetical protein